MNEDKLIQRLSRYTPKVLSDHLDPDFANAVYEAVGVLMADEQWELRLNEEIELLRKELSVARRIKDFAMANLADCKNELCERCGKYKESHLGACDGCRWEKVAAGGG